MGSHKDLTDIEWCCLDVLMAARKAGAGRVNRHELLMSESESIPQSLRMKMTFTLLLLSNGPLVSMDGPDFTITAEGVQVYNLRWGAKAEPVAMDVIYLPDRSKGAFN